MKRFAMLLAAVALLTGCGGAPAPEPLEDEPGFNCQIHGNKVCGPTSEAQKVEAWDKFTPPVSAEPLRADYLGTALPGIDFPPSEYVTVPATANTVHVFHIEPGVTK